MTSGKWIVSLTNMCSSIQLIDYIFLRALNLL